MDYWKVSAMARKWITAVYNTTYGAKFEDVVWSDGIYGRMYVQWLVGGSFIMAGGDGEMYYWDGSVVHDLGIPWMQ
ncbi:MAG: hypothetical protein HQK95_03945 [Nitrospirae bacterium]|nr:hypothetical protein [Nitrospirota bacterium]